MDRVAQEMLDELAKTPGVSPEMRRLLEHLYRAGRLVMQAPTSEQFELRCRCTFALGPVPSLDDFVVPYNRHLSSQHKGEEIEPLPAHPIVREVLYQPSSSTH